MAGAAPSTEGVTRRTVRMALGVTTAFVVFQLINWPLSFLAPVMTAVLLLEAAPLTVRKALGVFVTALMAILGGYVVTMVLLPYPAILVLAAGGLLFRFYLFAIRAGAPLLSIVVMLIGLILVPVVVLVLPELGLIAGVGILTNVALAMLVAWTAFVLIPPPDPGLAGVHIPPPLADAIPIATRLTLVVTPLFAGFMVFGWSEILVLVYGVLFSLELSDTGGAKAGVKSVVANLIFAGVGMLVVYELVVMVPNVVFMALLILTVCMIYGSRIFGHGPRAALWTSGFFGFFLLIGGALLAEDVDTTGKLLGRVGQIGLASLYIVFAYRVLDLLAGLGPALRARFRSRSEAPAG